MLIKQLTGADLKKPLESPLDCKEIQPVHPKGDQPWVFIGRTDVEAEALLLWPSDVKSQLIGKDPDSMSAASLAPVSQLISTCQLLDQHL